MPATFTWLDYSEDQRRQALDVIDLFRSQDTRDELGIGTVRDAIADLLFPGTSTIQTRARYFLFIPWIYAELERLRVPANRVASRARAEEVTLIDALARSSDSAGTIGIEARSKLKRLPSNVYWQGLWQWGIRQHRGSQEQYHRDFARLHAHADRTRPEEGPPVRNWHSGLPVRPPGFPREASFALTADEADYLRDRILSCCAGTLLAYLANHPQGGDEAGFPWEHRLAPTLPPRLQSLVAHAQSFSEVMHGAALLYNLMLAELQQPDWVEEYSGLLETWFGTLQGRAAEVLAWDRLQFWNTVKGTGARIPPPTYTFVEAWVERVLGALQHGEPLAELIADRYLRGWLEAREVNLKGPLARLPATNKHVRENWGGHSGTAQLAFRWPTARSFLRDIQDGWKGGGPSA